MQNISSGYCDSSTDKYYIYINNVRKQANISANVVYCAFEAIMEIADVTW